MICIYVVTFQEELMLPYFIRHYRKNFPDCRIIVYDNHSTDATVKIAEAADCEVIPYDTGNHLDDMKYLEIKNHCWQGQKERWAMVVDCDELCDITAEQLGQEERGGATMIRFDGINMVNHKNNLDVHNIVNGVKDPMYSKSYLFDTKYVTGINYTPGCHKCSPDGHIVKSDAVYNCFHYKFINADLMIHRYKRNAQRMAAYGRSKGMGSHYWKNESIIRQEFLSVQHLADKVREPMENISLKICVSGFDDSQFNRIHGLHLHKVNLSKLQVNEFQDNRLSEHRLFLSHEIEKLNCNYTGNITWRYNQKCKHLVSAESIWQLPVESNVVWAAWVDKNWYRKSCIDHKGLQKYLAELVELTGLSIEGNGFLANQFICSKEVYLEFQIFFRKWFEYFHNKYGFTYDFWVKESDKNRIPAVFYERFAALYFANRKDLIIKQIPNR